MTRRLLLSLFVTGLLAPAADGPVLQLPLRTRVEAFKGSGAWEEVRITKEFPVRQLGILICDMWDNHWCTGASQRVEVLARKMAPLIDQARAKGIRIIHSPSDVIGFYKDYPQRRRILTPPGVEPPPEITLSDPPLPIDDSDGGCDTPGDKPYRAWTRQHTAISVGPDDVISDKGAEVYSFLRHSGIRNLLVMGVHTNMCVLNRTFAIKQMTKWGIRCVLVRDLTDAMYDPKDYPHVSHERGTELVIEHIEKYWCPSVLSTDLAQAMGTVTDSQQRRKSRMVATPARENR